MKSPLLERPIFNQLERRVETHIFLCLLAYHLLVSCSAGVLTRGTSRRAHVLGDDSGAALHPPVGDRGAAHRKGQTWPVRKATTPEPEPREIYQALGVPATIVPPVKSRSGCNH